MSQNNNSDTAFKTVVSADKKIFDLKLKETLKYKDMILLFVKREFVAKYKQTILGPLWAIIQPLFTTVVYTIIFGTLAQLTTADAIPAPKVPTFLFYMSGTILWSYFSSVVSATSHTFLSNAHIMGKVYFPRIAMPIATAISHLISFAIQLVMFAVTYIVCIINGSAEFVFSYQLIFVPLSILQLMILSTGIGIIISALTTKYRDLSMLVGFGLNLWQYATPVAYGLLLIPAEYVGAYNLNPVTPAILSFRYGVFGAGYFDLKYYLLGWVVTLVIAFLGLLLFNRIEKNFADTV
ncbi:MAG: ABC transporter permease [Clostridia bacterium]|nr:ABC transporter permease [Clostridia bacterium]